jgi:peptidoglycan/LPS O-acetylase OafA/YrhL
LVGSGFVAVSFFYVLSGFVLSYSYVNREGEMLGSRWSFWVARFARIYPAYLLAFLIAAPFNISWTLRVNHFSTGVAKLVSGAALVLTMQQAWIPWTAWHWNYPAWSVSVETFFYLVFPFAALGLNLFRGKACLLGMCALWIISLIAPLSLCLVHGTLTSTGDRLQMAVEFTPLLRLPEFLIGMLLGRAYVGGFRLTPGMTKLLSCCSLLVVLICLAYCLAISRPLLANGLLMPLFAILIYSLAEGEACLRDCFRCRLSFCWGRPVMAFTSSRFRCPISCASRPHISVLTASTPVN